MADQPQLEGRRFQGDSPGQVGSRITPSKGIGLRDGLIITVFVGVLVGFAVYMAVRQNTQASNERSGFQAVIDRYIFSPVEPGPGAIHCRAGKVVLVDVEQRKFDDLHLAMPEKIRARAPAEVATVAQMHYTRKQVGHFETGARAIQVSCKITVVDLSSRTIIASRSFDWGKPPTSIPRAAGKEDVTGSAPWKEITAFLTSLR